VFLVFQFGSVCFLQNSVSAENSIDLFFGARTFDRSTFNPIDLFLFWAALFFYWLYTESTFSFLLSCAYVDFNFVLDLFFCIFLAFFFSAENWLIDYKSDRSKFWSIDQKVDRATFPAVALQLLLHCLTAEPVSFLPFSFHFFYVPCIYRLNFVGACLVVVHYYCLFFYTTQA
jgi:hypothetical protein